MRSERLPANLIQAQRDFFGAHTFERIDRARGEFSHHVW
jgi:6-phosphogluconate dehydrogenase